MSVNGHTDMQVIKLNIYIFSVQVSNIYVPLSLNFYDLISFWKIH